MYIDRHQRWTWEEANPWFPVAADIPRQQLRQSSLASGLVTMAYSSPETQTHHSDFVIPDNKVHEACVGPAWGRQDPGGPHVGPMNLAIGDVDWER